MLYKFNQLIYRVVQIMPSWQNKPFLIDVKTKEKKVFCMCGLSQNGPFCDGSHKGTNIIPRSIIFDKNSTIRICGCQKSNKMPYCDGTHTKY